MSWDLKPECRILVLMRSFRRLCTLGPSGAKHHLKCLEGGGRRLDRCKLSGPVNETSATGLKTGPTTASPKWSYMSLSIHPPIHLSTWTSKKAQNNGPIFQNREYRKYRVHYLGHFGGPGTHIHIYIYIYIYVSDPVA